MKRKNNYHSTGVSRRLLSKPILILLSLVFFTSVSGQEFFATGINNPFGFNFTPTESDLVFPSLVDIDGDGDLDAFVSHRTFFLSCWYVSSFEFFENQGTAECPSFVKIEDEIFGLSDHTAAIDFADMDNDGDMDAFVSNHCINSTLTYHENKGSATAPQFDAIPTRVINIGMNIGFAMLALGDLDGDGDYDALVNGLRAAQFIYLENVGTAEDFDFSDPIINPYGLSIPLSSASEWSQFADIDCDGDLDILNSHWQGGSSHENWTLYIHENNGTPTEPSFLPLVNTNKLMIVATVGDLDGDGDYDIFSDENYFKNISVNNCVTLPTASFAIEVNNLQITVSNGSSGQSTDCNPMEYLWDFGDGTTSIEFAPSHNYDKAGIYNVCLTVKDIAGETTYCEETAVATTSVEEIFFKQNVSIFPSPALDQLRIKTSGDIPPGDFIIQIFQIQGQALKSVKYNSAELAGGVEIDISDLPVGIYMINIFYNDLIFGHKFIKAR